MCSCPSLLIVFVYVSVCKAAVREIDSALSKVDPGKHINVGYRLGADGETASKKIPLIKSETFLTDMLESICDNMDDYARAKYKSNGKLTVMRLVTESGGMNPDMAKVDFVQDEDLNKSLKYYVSRV